MPSPPAGSQARDDAGPPGGAGVGVSIGAVAIGRNEGERLERCLRSLLAAGLQPVYVDSGSTDGSRALAARLGVPVIALDLTRPFTAARARNVGLAALLQRSPELELVQFVDGDCELESAWIPAATAALADLPRAAAVCGRRRERYPRATRYNLLCDLEWDTPIGPAEACGGDALLRVAPLSDAGGYREELIAGEEPELCHRLGLAGWQIQRLDVPMTVHDAAMTRFGQWWSRSKRSGYAAAEAWALHGTRGQRGMVRLAASALVYGLGVPLLALVIGALAWRAFGAAGWLAAPALVALAATRVATRASKARRARGTMAADARLYGAFCALGKLPEAFGVLRYALGRLGGRPSALIEYKDAAKGAAEGAAKGAAAPSAKESR
jgi:GT2 family glycosyltransferase